MEFSNCLFLKLGVDRNIASSISNLSKRLGISRERLIYYNDNNILPTGIELAKIIDVYGFSEMELMLSMGRMDEKTLKFLKLNAKEISKIQRSNTLNRQDDARLAVKPIFETAMGKLHQGNCLDILKMMDDESVDLVFADPPFNLNKMYASGMDDNLTEEAYLFWCQKWLKECARVLKHGGALFLWNLPKWNASIASYLNGYLSFKHWIGVDIKYSLPITGRLYPSHYGLLYYVKGSKPESFHPDRLPMSTCPKCFGDLKDYGGYKNKMNPTGINLSDIWTDIPPVRHAKYKRRIGANELSLKLMDRIIEMASKPNDVVFDPFGGSGTTYMAAELKGRRWIGCEIGPVDDIVNRFAVIEDERAILAGYRAQLNQLFPEKTKKQRIAKGIWVCETFLESGD